jgi:hypothetical protein
VEASGRASLAGLAISAAISPLRAVNFCYRTASVSGGSSNSPPQTPQISFRAVTAVRAAKVRERLCSSVPDLAAQLEPRVCRLEPAPRVLLKASGGKLPSFCRWTTIVSRARQRCGLGVATKGSLAWMRRRADA